MSRIHVDDIYDKEGTGAPSLPAGVVVTGVTTSTSFAGALTGNASSATVANGLQGTPNITVGSVEGTTGTFSGSVSIGGTLTYEDVANVDSVGLITARTGVRVTTGGVTVSAGGVDVSAGGLSLKGQLKEQVKVTAGKLSDNLDINIDNGNIHLFTTQETTTSTPNIVSNAGINTDLAVGDAISVTVVTTAAAGGYSAQLTIDGAAVTENWIGGSAPSDGGSSGVDIYAYTIMKTASATYTVVATQTKTS